MAEMPTDAEQVRRLVALAKRIGRDDIIVMTGCGRGYIDVATLSFKAFNQYEFTAATPEAGMFDLWKWGDLDRVGLTVGDVFDAILGFEEDG